MQSFDIFSDTVKAKTAITEFAPVTYDGALAGATDLVYGVARCDADIGNDVAVVVLGTAQVHLTEDVAPGDLLIPDGTGKVKKGTGTGFARARKTGAAGELAEVFLIHAIA